MKSVAYFVAVTLAVAAATWLGGWWTVPIVALVAGLAGYRAALTAAGAASAWALLLLGDVLLGTMARLSELLSGVMGLPTPALIAITLAFPALLAWSAASIGHAARSLRTTSRQPS